jgi:hypothetical protein
MLIIKLPFGTIEVLPQVNMLVGMSIDKAIFTKEDPETGEVTSKNVHALSIGAGVLKFTTMIP